MYSRFFTKALYNLDVVGFEEPFKNLFIQVRSYVLFMGPAESGVKWSDQGVERRLL
jgi:leucyl-tRNA synthetase